MKRFAGTKTLAKTSYIWGVPRVKKKYQKDVDFSLEHTLLIALFFHLQSLPESPLWFSLKYLNSQFQVSMNYLARRSYQHWGCFCSWSWFGSYQRSRRSGAQCKFMIGNWNSFLNLKKYIFSCLDYTFPVHLFYQLYM